MWAWPGELVNIASVYEEFEDWARDKAAKKDWYSKPAAQGFVSTQKFTRIRFGEQPAKMSDFEIQETGNPNADVTFYNQVPSVYPEVKQTAATLALKQEGDIYVTAGETIDLLNYVNTNYPDKVFCVSTSYGEQEPVAGSFTQFKTLQANHRTLMHIRIATPGGLLNVDVYVNSGTSSEDSVKKDNSITLYDNGTPVYNIPTIAAGETKTYTIKSNGSGSYSVVGSEYFTASVSGNTLTITGVKAGSANLIINQAADGTYKPATGTYWLTATGAPAADESADYGTSLNVSTIEGYGNAIDVADLPTSGSVTLTYVIDWPWELNDCSVKGFWWDESNIYWRHWAEKDLGVNKEKKGGTYILTTTVDASAYQGCRFVQLIFYSGTLKGAYYKQN